MISHNLPQQSTAFIGREDELSEIAGLLADPSCRLLTLVGHGGIGKTRLAIQAATSQQRCFANGVSFVALSPVVSPDFLQAAIGGALEIPFFGSEEPLFQIMSYLRDKEMLLVMDNFEHLLEGVGCLTELLQAAPRLKILATSRERLNLREEWVLMLDGLSYPTEPFADSLEEYSAVQLFFQRARQVQNHFSLDDDIHSVLSICRLVEGMPLGLELAASWLRAMSCRQIAARMASSFDFLTTPMRNMPERHRSLRVVFEKSWSLLAADEQAVLMRLSIFHGGFDLEAAAEVANATLMLLAGLADKSLLRMDSTGRYDLHELVRQYAKDKLTKAGEISNTHQQHLAYFMKMAEAGEAQVYGRDQVTWCDLLEVEMDNLRAALAWSLSNQEIEGGLRLAGALRWMWEMRGHLDEGLAWFAKLLASGIDDLPPISPPISSAVRAKALHRACELAGQLAHEPQAMSWAQEALRLSRLTNDPWNLAWSLSSAAYFTEQDSNQAVAMLEESLALFHELRDPLGLSHTRRRLVGCAMDQHNYAYAIDLLEDALAGDREAGDKNTMAWDLCFMGVVLWSHQRRPEHVIPLYQESISLFHELKDVRGAAHPLVMLAEVERTQGNFAQSLAYFQEILRLEQELGIRDNLALLALAGIASLAATHGEYERATRMLGSVHGALESDSYKTRLSAVIDIFDVTLPVVRSQLSENAFDAAWLAGHTMSLEQAITAATHCEFPKDELPKIEIADLLSRKESNHSLPEALSPREVEVLHLLGDGLSNAEIAQKLFISVATVKVHTRSIYGKLMVNNRTQAIIQAQKLSLL